MPISGTFYTQKELTELLKVSKQRVSDLARKHEWGSPLPGLYRAEDVTEYVWSRWRMELAREFGETVSGLVKHDEWDKDDNCPVCGSFAIWKPASAEETKDLEKPVYADGWPWKCIQGHGG